MGHTLVGWLPSRRHGVLGGQAGTASAPLEVNYSLLCALSDVLCESRTAPGHGVHHTNVIYPPWGRESASPAQISRYFDGIQGIHSRRVANACAVCLCMCESLVAKCPPHLATLALVMYLSNELNWLGIFIALSYSPHFSSGICCFGFLELCLLFWAG